MIKSAILRLYKQHHIKKYETLTEGQYSCWGNYDSMSIEMVRIQKNTLIVSRDTLGLTDMWYQLSDMLGSQNGTYSQQCIGLIYEKQDNDVLESFLIPDEYFCCACLIKLQNSYQTCVYDNLSLVLGTSDDSSGYAKSICFRTMDNADAVVLIKGNSYQKIMDQVINISKKVPEILYTYSICGVNQQYLINNKWTGAKHPLIDDKIHQITSRIVANPAIDTKKLEEVFGGSGEWAWVFGNTDIVWQLKEDGQTINRAINLMRPYTDGKLVGHAAVSHSHPLYGNEVYGITTEVIAQRNVYQVPNKTVAPFPTSAYNVQENQWCRNRILELKKRLRKSRDEKNDLLYSYYLALIQSLNMIVPYEESLFAKDLFYIVFPSLLMFHKQLDAALEERDRNNAYSAAVAEKWDALIKNLARYLDMLDQIIYRSIHSEQTFFIVPGYCGVLYTILPKLSMMYMALLYAGIEILQEDSEIYECCLYPVVDSKPSTTEIDFHLKPAERLIEIKVSQRSMFMANLMPILLLHELSHYVGTSRNRVIRAFYMICTWGALLTKMLLWDNGILKKPFQKECLKLIHEENQKGICEYITEELKELISKENKKREKEEGKELYFNDVFFMLIRFSDKILQDTDGILQNKIQKKGDKLKAKICKNNNYKMFLNHMQELEELYDILNKQRVSILGNGISLELEKNMKLCFKETYADIISLYLIGFQNSPKLFERYLEAFYLSEGVEFNINSLSNEDINRIAVTVTVLPSLDPYAKKCWNTVVRNKKKKYKNNKNKMNSIDYLVLYAHIYQIKMQKGDRAIRGGILEEIASNMRSEKKDSIAELKETWDSQMKYFNCVVEEILEKEAETARIMDSSMKKRVDSKKREKSRIRELYSLLNDPVKNNTVGLQAFDDIIRWYTDMVDRKKIESLQSKDL